MWSGVRLNGRCSWFNMHLQQVARHVQRTLNESGQTVKFPGDKEIWIMQACIDISPELTCWQRLLANVNIRAESLLFLSSLFIVWIITYLWHPNFVLLWTRVQNPDLECQQNVSSVLHCKTGPRRFHYRIVCVPLRVHYIKFGCRQSNVREASLLFRGTRAGAGNILFVQIVGPRDLPCRPRMPSDACRLPSKHFESYCIV